jgi:hypothetical protein
VRITSLFWNPLTSCKEAGGDDNQGGQTAILVRWSAGLLPSGLPKY